MAHDHRIPALDGLRAIAIAGVLLFHVEPRIFSIGWLGIVLFFVLSGYLITGILLDSKSRPNYFGSFYFRRAVRIFPAYYLLLLVSAVAIYVLAPDSAYLTAKLRLQSGSLPEPSAWVPFILSRELGSFDAEIGCNRHVRLVPVSGIALIARNDGRSQWTIMVIE